MATIPFRAVTSNLTGSVVKSGRTDFAGQFDPADFTQQDLSDSATFVPGIDFYYHKVVGGLLVEMDIAEKAAVDTERQLKREAKLAGIPRIEYLFNTPADLPLPPPGLGYLVGIKNADGAGTPGIAISTNTNYAIILRDLVYP